MESHRTHRSIVAPGITARRLIALIVVMLWVAACSSTSDAEAEPELREGPSTSLVEPDFVPPGEQVTALQGQLAVSDGHELSVMRPDGSDIIAVAGSDTEVATQPTWSPDGARLAWAFTDGVRSRIEVAVPGEDESESTEFATLPFYLGWDPEGSRVAYLRNETAGPRFEMGTFVPGSDPIPGELGSPLYLSWRPGVEGLALHVDAERSELLGLSGRPEPAQAIAATAGEFAAPVWANENSLLLVQNGMLVVHDVESGEQRELLEIGQATRLVLSPDRTQLAYLTVVRGTQTISAGSSARFAEAPAPDDADDGDADDGELPGDPVAPSEPETPGAGVRLRVFDLQSGRDQLVTARAPLAFEWSPNGAYLSWLAGADAGLVQWHIWSPAGEVAALTPYRPSAVDAGTYLPFFDQYAQSHHRWDPDGLAMAFAGAIDDRSGIWIELVEGDDEPFLVAEGDYVTWSPPPSAGAGASPL